MVKATKRKAYKDVWQIGLMTPDASKKSGYSFNRSQPNPEGDVLIAKKGEYYYSWPLWGDNHLSVSKDYPKRQMLTKSDFAKSVYTIEDMLEEVLKSDLKPNEKYHKFSLIFQDIRDLADMQFRKLDNMPEHLRDLHVGSLLQNRGEALYDWLSILNVEYSIAKGTIPDYATKFNI